MSSVRDQGSGAGSIELDAGSEAELRLTGAGEIIVDEVAP